MDLTKYAGGIILLALFFGACTPREKPVDRPNIVWITSEDNSKHYMELFDPNGIETPSIERLADRGIKFTRAFSNAPVCSAARSTLISGCYGPRVASHYHRKLRKVPMPESVEMFPAYLREAGYYTTNNSKEDYNIFKSDSVWDESSKKASWRNRSEGQPFFHVQNIGVSHESGLFFTEEEMKTVDTLTDRASCFVLPNHPQTEVFRYTNARYRDKVAVMDKMVGEIVRQLEEDGLMEHTFIFYFGDHGGVLPGSKGYLYEVGLHIPLVVYVPPKYRHLVSLDAGTASDAFVSFIDFGPTVLHLAGVDVPKGIDGKSFLGKGISAEALNSLDETYGYADRFDEKYDMVRSVRKGKFKYIRNYQPFNFDGLMNNYRYRQTGYREWLDLYKMGALNNVQADFFETKPPEALFDLEADPYETTNLAESADHGETLEMMRNKLNTWIKGMPDLSFYPEFYLIRHAFDNPVRFGRKHQNDIENYAEIADLALLDFSQAKPKIENAINSDDPWKRYWGLIVCTSFAGEAGDMLSRINEIAESDTELINRVRAAEYLGVTRKANPSNLISEALYASEDPNEALLMLNSVVLMQDGFDYVFEIEPDKLHAEVSNEPHVKRRLEYLNAI
ncbi:MAG: sulfatase [Cytophagales bacterium]|nr:sulfatase [Cytophagales bacterium]